MSDETEAIRRQQLAEINAQPGSREAWKPSMGRCGTRSNWVRTSTSRASWPRTSSSGGSRTGSGEASCSSTTQGSTSRLSRTTSEPRRQPCPRSLTSLHPRRFPGMSGRMAAVVGYILGRRWSTPRIAELVVTSDGWVLARNAGHVGFNTIIGTAADLERNWNNLLRAAGLTGEERQEADERYRQR